VRIHVEIERAKRSGTPLSLLSLDLDHFKKINDKYGHPGGDSVLCEFVQKCLDAIRPYDVIARVGGEEFMVLLPKAALDAACAVGERFRSAISDDTFEVGIPPPIKITVSIGCRSLGAMETRSTRFWVSLMSGFAARNVKVVIV
jgi:two-component system, cell cycle response regulator